MTLKTLGFRSTTLLGLLTAGVTGWSCGGDSGACDRAKAIEEQLLAERDKDAAAGVISHDQAPCNFTAEAKTALQAVGKLQWYADACAQYQDAANSCGH